MAALCPGPIYQRDPRIRDEERLAWVRTQPCLICGIEATSEKLNEAAHYGPHGLSAKTHDRNTFPACAKCHRTGRNSYHTLGKRWDAFYGLDMIEVLADLQRRYDSRRML